MRRRYCSLTAERAAPPRPLNRITLGNTHQPVIRVITRLHFLLLSVAILGLSGCGHDSSSGDMDHPIATDGKSTDNKQSQVATKKAADGEGRNMRSDSYKTKKEDIQIPLQSNHSFKGTLVLPDSRSPVAAIVMFPGFVPGARNQTEEAWRDSSAEDSGTTLTRYLAGLGFAVLQVPIGGDATVEPPLSLNDLADRALGGVKYLKGRPEVDPARIGIIGQSVGGFVAAMAAARSKDLAFMVTLATPMDSIDRTFDEVLDGLLRNGGAPEQERASIRRKMEQVYAAAAKGASAEALRPAVEDFLRAEYVWLPKQLQQMAGKDADAFVHKQLEDHVRDLTTPMYRSMIGYDVGQTVTKINCPMLILFAERDFKVEPKRGSEMATALLRKAGRTHWTVKIIPGANHFFEGSDQAPEPAKQTPEQRFARPFLDTLRGWLLQKTAALPQ